MGASGEYIRRIGRKDCPTVILQKSDIILLLVLGVLALVYGVWRAVYTVRSKTRQVKAARLTKPVQALLEMEGYQVIDSGRQAYVAATVDDKSTTELGISGAVVQKNGRTFLVRIRPGMTSRRISRQYLKKFLTHYLLLGVHGILIVDPENERCYPVEISISRPPQTIAVFAKFVLVFACGALLTYILLRS